MAWRQISSAPALAPVRCSGRSLRLLAPALVVAVALAACGGGSGGGASSGGGTEQPADGQAGALAASKPGDLLAAAKALLAARRAAGYTGSVPSMVSDAMLPIGAAVIASSESAQPRSNTTVQEAGVDEDDLIKSDGDMIYSLDTIARGAAGEPQPALNLHRRAADGRVTLMQGLKLPTSAPSTSPSLRGMLLAPGAKRLAVLGQSVSYSGTPSSCPPGAYCINQDSLIYWPGTVHYETQVQGVELGAASASLGTHLAISGQLVDSRLIGTTLYLVTTHSPQLPDDKLPASATVAERDAAIAKLTAADLLPTLRINGGPAQALLNDTDCYLQPKNASLQMQYTTLTAIDLGQAGLPRSSRCFAGGTEAIYMSPTNLYLATTLHASTLMADGVLFYAPQTTTDIHKFSVSGQTISYRGSGSVDGHLGWMPERKPYRLSEQQGDLRVLSFTGQMGWGFVNDAANAKQAPSPATLTVLRERSSDRSLQVLAKLPNAQRPAPLGKPGEQVFGVRFMGDRGYMVTFRQTDPLYVLDLSNPADPQQLGELVVPGFSDHLYPLDKGLLLGVGRDADADGRLGGVKLALFDVQDARQPKLVASQVYGLSGSTTTLDWSRHGIGFLQRGSTVRVAFPLSAFDHMTWTNGLQRLEVDTVARSLVSKPMLAPTPSPGWTSLVDSRSLQIGDQVYYLDAGKLTGFNW
jgi:hypothetical protein